jgi:O-antigen ligase
MRSSSYWLSRLLPLAVFAFPITVASVENAGSGIALLLLIAGLFFGRQWNALDDNEKPVLIGFVVLLLVMALSLVNSSDLDTGVARLERFVRIAALMPVYLMLRRFGIFTGRAFVYGGAVAGPVLAFQAWYQVDVLHKGFADGAYHKIVFGDMAMLAAVLALLGACCVANSRLKQFAFVTGAAAAIYASVLSGTRGAWILLPLLGAFVLWLYRRQLTRRAWAGVAAMVLLFGFAAANTDTVRSGLESGAADLRTFMTAPAAETSWGIRLNLWRNSLFILKDSPLLGTGLGDFQHDMVAMTKDGRSLNPYVAGFSHAHSIYFHALATSGLLGFAALVIALFYLPFRYFHRHWSPAADPMVRFYSLGGMISLASFAVFGFSEGWLARNPFVVAYVMCMLVFMGGLANTLAKTARQDMGEFTPPKTPS